MTALGRVVRAGVTRRRVQTLVMTLTTLMAVTASVVAAGVLVASRAPFDHAMAARHGAQLTAQFDGAKAGATQLTATTHTSGVTAAAGPFRTLSLRARTTSASGPLPAGATLPPLTVVGRSDPGGSVDRLGLVTGRWATRPGEIVLLYGGVPAEPGTRLEFPELPGRPALTVVGLARSVTGTADAWVTPAQAELLGAGTAPTYEMLYRFREAATDAQMSAHRAAIGAAVPRGALTGTQSYLTVRQHAIANAMAFVPFVAAFVGSMNRIPGELREGKVELIGGVLSVVATDGGPASGSVTALVRPETVHLGLDDAGPATVVRVSFRGPVTRVTSLLTDGTELHADLASGLAEEFTPGRRVRPLYGPDPVMVLPD